MGKARLEAFSDGVLAIIITITVLALVPPRGARLDELAPVLPVFLTYVLSFVYLGIYWNNHHHLLLTLKSVSGSVLWANLHLLFWLSLFPFATGWMGNSHFSPVPSACYGAILFMASVAYWILEQAIIRAEGPNSVLRTALGWDWKGRLSPVIYLVAIAMSLFSHWIGQSLYAVVALLWLVPDRRIERALGKPPA